MDQQGGNLAPAVRTPERRRLRLRTFTSLRHHNFRLIWTTTFFSSAGMWIQQVTLGWLAYDLTGSALLVGSLSAARSVPTLVAGPIAGVLVDRMDRRKLLIETQTAMALLALAFAALVASPYLQVWHLFVYTMLSGVGWSVNNPLRQALVANSVPKEDLMNALALNSMAFNVNRALGPAAGGVLIAFSGPATNFFIQAFFYVAVALAVVPLRIPPADYSANRRASMLTNFQEGLRYVRTQPVILGLILLALVPSLFLFPFTQGLMPVFAKEVLHTGPQGLGLLLSFSGVGALVGVIALASWGTVQRKGQLLLGAATVAGVMLIVFSFTRSMPLSLGALTIMGASQQVYMVTNNTMIQTITPDAFRGRVMSLYHLDNGFAPLGGLLAGAVAEFWGSPTAVLVGGACAVALVLIMGASLHSLRRA